MKIEHCEFPDDLLYEADGLVWARPLESGDLIVGITSILEALAGPVMKVAAKPLGVTYARGATVGLLESGKYFGPIRAPVSGVLREVNADVLAKLFFFSSRRRHTRFDCDWSSDVCSSD